VTEARARALQALVSSRVQLREALAPPVEDEATSPRQGARLDFNRIVDLARHIFPQGHGLSVVNKLLDAAFHASPLTATGLQVGRFGALRVQEGVRRHPWLWAGVGVGVGALLFAKRRWAWRLATAFALPRLLRTGQALGQQVIAELGPLVLSALHQGAEVGPEAQPGPLARTPMPDAPIEPGR
jgi:hypothetical protein